MAVTNITKNGYVEIRRAKGKKSKEFFAREVKLKRVIGSPAETYKRKGGILKNLIAKLKMYGGEKVLVNDTTAYGGAGIFFWLHVDGTKEEIKSWKA